MGSTSAGTAAVVLAGGSSRRFGSDKTRATLHGSALLDRVVAAVEPVVDDVVVIGPWAPEPHRHLLEPQPGAGPLSGLAFGLGQVDADRALVLAADHPLLNAELLSALLGALDAEGPLREHQAAVPVAGGRPQPLVASYRTSVASDAEQLLDDGERSLRALLEQIDTRWLEESEWRAADPSGISFLDVDHPEQLERLARSVPELDELQGLADAELELLWSDERER